jgi:hypothetical protein
MISSYTKFVTASEVFDLQPHLTAELKLISCQSVNQSVVFTYKKREHKGSLF